MNEMYPKLRRNDYKIIYEIRNFDLEEARRLIYEHPKKLSVDEMYKVAGSYEPGTDEYNDVLEIAVRLYPEVVAAAVNAANLALEEGKYDKALAILEQSNQDDARIQAAEGYVYILMQEYDKAREVLTKAAAQGNEDAKHNLAEMEKHLDSI
jgi:tetratricopeptide (TPR) repeat protein